MGIYSYHVVIIIIYPKSNGAAGLAEGCADFLQFHQKANKLKLLSARASHAPYPKVAQPCRNFAHHNNVPAAVPWS